MSNYSVFHRGIAVECVRMGDHLRNTYRRRGESVDLCELCDWPALDLVRPTVRRTVLLAARRITSPTGRPAAVVGPTDPSYREIG